MFRPHTRSTLFPYTTLFRSIEEKSSPEKIERNADLERSRFGNFTNTLGGMMRSEEHTFELQSPYDLVCRLLLEKKKDFTWRMTVRFWRLLTQVATGLVYGRY